MGWLGQGQVCQCFYFEHIDDLFKPSNLMTLTTLTTSKRLAEQTLSLLRLCTPVCFTHFTTPMQRVHVHTGVCRHSRYIFTRSCIYSKLYLRFAVYPALHS